MTRESVALHGYIHKNKLTISLKFSTKYIACKMLCNIGVFIEVHDQVESSHLKYGFYFNVTLKYSV